MVRVALYARVSKSEEPGDERYQEPMNQLSPLRDWGKAMGYEVIQEYVDHASGADPSRPEFRNMMADAGLRKFDGILVWKSDRFSREGVICMMAYVRTLRSRGVFLRSLSESWLDTSQEGVADMILAVMAWVASEERKRISERTKAGIAQLRAIGRWHGGRPKGSLGKKSKEREAVLTHVVDPADQETSVMLRAFQSLEEVDSARK
jgi:DNA invertase Pin-like site-specific DNA recombinase